jgi:sigma-B regulation protein RsbU (phosphoserine phosphatase)
MANRNETSDIKSETQKELGAKKLEIKSLLELTMAINNNKPAEDLFRIYQFILFAQQKLSKLLLFAHPGEDDQWQLVCRHGLVIDDIDTKIDSIIDELVKVREVTGAEQLPNLKLKGCEVVIPVYHKESPLAFAVVGKRTDEKNKGLSSDEIHFIHTITNIIAVAVENKKLFKKQLFQARFKREMELAAEIQKMLIPSDLPQLKNMLMSALYLPHSEVGGDYYDIIEKNGHLMVCIGDISGKGISAAMLMSNVQANFRALAREDIGLVEMIRRLNKRFVKITNGERFITFFVATIDLESGEIEYVNAGHNPPLLIQDHKLKLLETGSTILGAFDDLPDIMVGKENLKKGDLLFLYTDGLIDLESENDERYGEERLNDFLIDHCELELEDLVERLKSELIKFKKDKDFYDDISYFAFKRPIE